MLLLRRCSWAAPNSRVRPPADVYAFGAVLWELLTWELPFRDMNMFQAGAAAARGREGREARCPPLVPRPSCRPAHMLASPPPLPLQIITLMQATDADLLEVPPPDCLAAGPFRGYERYVDLLQACRAHEPAARPPFDAIVARLRWAGALCC